MATKKAAGAGTPTAAGHELFDRHSTSNSILPQDPAERDRVAGMIIRNLVRLYGEATGQEITVKSIRYRGAVKEE